MKRNLVPTLVALALVTMLSGCGKSTAPTALGPIDEAPPAAPTELTRVQDTSLPSGYLDWSPSPSANVAEYEIYQFQPDPGREDAYVLVGQTEAGTTSWPLPVSVVRQTLYYRLKAVSPTGLKSEWSATGEILLGPNAADPEPRPVEEQPMTPVKH